MGIESTNSIPGIKVGDGFGTIASRTDELEKTATRKVVENTDSGVFTRYFTTDANGNEVYLGSSFAADNGIARYVENNGTVFNADPSGNIWRITRNHGTYEDATSTSITDKNSNRIIDDNEISNNTGWWV